MLAFLLLGVISMGIGGAYFFKPAVFYAAYIRYWRWLAGVRRKQCQVGDVMWLYSERASVIPDRATMLLVHGFSSASDSWNQVIKKLPSDIHIVAVDLPGHGDTNADPNDPMTRPVDNYATNLKSFVDKIGLETQPLHLVGLSMGGAIVGVYAANYPRHVRQVSFICPAVVTPIKSKMHEAEEKNKENNPVLLPETAEDLLAMLNTYVVYKPINLPLQILRGAMDVRKKYIPFFKLLRKNFHLPENDGRLNKALDKVTAPAHIVWGEEDNIVHVSGASVLKENLPDVQQYDIFPECGHAVDMEKDELLAQKLALFWEKFSGKE